MHIDHGFFTYLRQLEPTSLIKGIKLLHSFIGLNTGVKKSDLLRISSVGISDLSIQASFRDLKMLKE